MNQPDPTTDRRDRIRRVLAEADGFSFDGLEPHDYQRHADAVMAVADAEQAELRRVADGLERDAAAPGVAEIVRPALRDAARQIRAALAVSAAEEQPENETPESPVACEGFVWIGQSFATCDRCAQPAWDHEGEDVPAEGAGPFDNRRTIRPWGPGEADAIRAKWAPPAVVPQPEEADRG